MKRTHFTLIELIMVIAIIVLLVGLGVGGYSYAMHASREASTRAAMKQLETALESFKAKHGFYPPSITPPSTTPEAKVFYIFNNSKEVNATLADKNNLGNSPQGVTYQNALIKTMDIEALHLESDSNGFYLVDAWGNKIWYVSPGLINKQSFDLISAGPDGKIGTTTSDTPSSSYTQSTFTDTDDLTNF